MSATPFASVEAEVRRERGQLVFSYRVTGSLSALRLPAPSRPARADGLWRTTCFEAFVRPDSSEAYVEINFSPSAEWAAYRFDRYRHAMADADIGAPAMRVAVNGRRFEIEAVIEAARLPLTPSARLGLAAVLEATSGAKSYWALAHSGDKPDFHRTDGFIARLPQGSAQ